MYQWSSKIIVFPDKPAGLISMQIFIEIINGTLIGKIDLTNVCKTLSEQMDGHVYMVRVLPFK